jgi:hypothetical protein
MGGGDSFTAPFVPKKSDATVSLETHKQTLAQFYSDEIAKIIAAAKHNETSWRQNPPASVSREELTDFYLQPTIFDRNGNVLMAK